MINLNKKLLAVSIAIVLGSKYPRKINLTKKGIK